MRFCAQRSGVLMTKCVFCACAQRFQRRAFPRVVRSSVVAHGLSPADVFFIIFFYYDLYASCTKKTQHPGDVLINSKYWIDIMFTWTVINQQRGRGCVQDGLQCIDWTHAPLNTALFLMAVVSRMWELTCPRVLTSYVNSTRLIRSFVHPVYIMIKMSRKQTHK